jgi:hypothetical protein
MHETPTPEADLGARRRALLADLVRCGLPGDRGIARLRARPRRIHPLPAMAVDAQDDAELRNRIQARVGRTVSHPGAIQVRVDGGVVRLTGRVLAKECEGLLEQLRQVPGVREVVNGMSVHDHPGEIALRPEPVSPAAATR